MKARIATITLVTLFAVFALSARVGRESLGLVTSLAGFFLSIVFPTLTAAVSDLHKDNQASILGLLFTFAGVGGMLGPWLIGLAGDALGLDLGFGINLVYCVLFIAVILVLIKETRHDGKAA